MFPLPCSRFSIPCSLFPVTYSLALTRPATCGESAVAVHPLPKGVCVMNRPFMIGSAEGQTVEKPEASKQSEAAGGAPELIVFSILRASQCSQCKTELESGSLLTLEKGQPLCMTCADLDHLVFLPRGDTALTRRAR